MLADELRLTHKTTFVFSDPWSCILKTPTRMSMQMQGQVLRRIGHVSFVASLIISLLIVWLGKGSKGWLLNVGLIKSSYETISVNELDDRVKPFIFSGFASFTGKAEGQRPVTILRDTACSQSLILSSAMPMGDQSDYNASTLVRGIVMSFVPAPLHLIHVQSPLVSRFFSVGVRSCFPIDGVDFIMGNDIAGGKVYPVPEVVTVPISDVESDNLAKRHSEIFSVTVLTRAQTRERAQDVDLSDSIFASGMSEDRLPSAGTSVNSSLKEAEKITAPVPLPLNSEALIAAQQKDPSLAKCFAAATSSHGENKQSTFFFENGVLMRRWVSQSGGAEDSSGEDWGTVFQVAIHWPSVVVVSMCWSRHMSISGLVIGGLQKHNRVLKHFFWPGMKADVVHFCNN